MSEERNEYEMTQAELVEAREEIVRLRGVLRQIATHPIRQAGWIDTGAGDRMAAMARTELARSVEKTV